MNDDYTITSRPKINRATAPERARANIIMKRERRRLAYEECTGQKFPADLTDEEYKILSEEQLAYRHALGLFKSSDLETAQMKELAALYATGDAPILITGESGSGKELIAKICHGIRDPKRFVALNCAGMNSELLGNE